MTPIIVETTTIKRALIHQLPNIHFHKLMPEGRKTLCARVDKAIDHDTVQVELHWGDYWEPKEGEQPPENWKTCKTELTGES